MERLCTPAALWLTLIMMVIISQDSFIFAFMWHPHTASPHPYSATVVRMAKWEEGCNSNDQNDQEYKSVSDYMGGWHAGKFDFDDRICGVTALNYEKSVVFGDMATSTTHAASQQLASLNRQPDDIPAWSQRPVVYEALSQGCITVGQSGKDDSSNNLTVQVSNQELSWEPFYATIETSQGRVMGTEEWTVIPSHGTLAPRGGADVYTDTCCFHVARHHNSIHDAQPQSCYLVVRTEQDAWAWQLTETENVEENAP